MGNIKFIGREKELEEIRNLGDRFFLVVNGRRRVGKTSLLRKAFPSATYLFIWPDKSLEWICREICAENNLPEFKNFKDILNYLLNLNKTIIIDEFQNFLNIDKSVYGEVQKIIDERKRGNKFLKIAIAGSSYSLMNKVFNDAASPLYGRRTNEITLRNLEIVDLYKETKFKLEEFIRIWSIFEGVPYYYEFLDKNKSSIENIKKLIIRRDAQLKNEGKAILSVEFGKDSKTYMTVLSAISEGKTKLNEISSLFGNKKNEVVKYLEILRKDFNLIKKVTPILDDSRKSREGRYELEDNFLSFWFLIIDRKRALIEQGRYDELEKYFEKIFNSYLGKKFEKFIMKLVESKILFKEKEFDKFGRQWGKYAGESGRNNYEIDFLGVNEDKKEILFGECKWKDEVDASRVLNKLNEKTNNVGWNKGNRKEILIVFAKSFSKKVKEFNGKEVLCVDLKEIQKRLKK